MYISLRESCAKGFKKWADAHQPEIKNDLGASRRNGLAAASPDHDNLAMTSLERAASSMARAGRGDAVKHIPPSPLHDFALPSPFRRRQREIVQGARRDVLYSVPAPGTSHGRGGPLK